MRRPVAAAAAHRRAHDERHGDLVVVHLAELRDPVDDLVEAERDEVAEHDLEDRPLAAQRHPGGDAEERRLGDRGRQHAVGVGVAQALRHLEGAAVRVEDVLAEEVDVVALGEELVQRLVQDLDAALLTSRGLRRREPAPPRRPRPSRRSRRSQRLLDRPPLVVAEPRAGDASADRASRRSSISAGSRLSSPFECGLKRYVSRTRKNGSPVSRTCATARPAASWISSTSVVASSAVSTPKAAARAGIEPGELELDRRRLRVVVVLDDEEDGQLPERGDVQRLVGDALAERAVAEEDGRHRAGALLLLRERDPGRDRDDAPEHAVRVEVALAQVLAPALAAADARRLAPSPRRAGRTRRP